MIAIELLEAEGKRLMTQRNPGDTPAVRERQRLIAAEINALKMAQAMLPATFGGAYPSALDRLLIRIRLQERADIEAAEDKIKAALTREAGYVGRYGPNVRCPDCGHHDGRHADDCHLG